MKQFAIVILLLLCASCIQIGGEPARINYYLLQSFQEEQHPYSSDTLTIDIKLIGFPQYLDRNQIVTHGQDSRIRVATSENWAEPLRDNLLRILRKDMSLLLPKAHITLSPWEESQHNALKIDLLINDFSGRLAKETIVDINWTIRKNEQIFDQGRFYADQPIGDSYSDLASGLSQSIEKLSHALAKKLITIQ